ncbi:MAG: hypothetical protein JW818_12960, partial [Pirellulales bacterium]|nr:hypothetical protein [Pirellulales bacterium]
LLPLLGTKDEVPKGPPHTNGAGPGGPHAEPSTEHEHGIRGSMTLAEVEEATGVPAVHLLEKLGLPQDTPPNSRLGPLRRQHGFAMEDVRRIVEEYKAR